MSMVMTDADMIVDMQMTLSTGWLKDSEFLFKGFMIMHSW